MNKRIALLIAAPLALTAAAALAQTTQLGPSMTSVAVTVTGAMNILPANPSRRALTVCNNDATNKVTISTGALSPVQLTTGLVLLNGNVVSSCFNFGSPGVTGPGGVGAQINAVASGGTVNVTFIEYY